MDLDTGKTHVIHDAPVQRVYSPDGQAFVAYDRKGQLYGVYLASGERIAGLGQFLSRIIWSPDGGAVAYHNQQGYLMVFDIKSTQTDQWLTASILEVLGWTPKGIWVLPVPEQ